MTEFDRYRDEEWVAVAQAPGGDPGRSLQPIHDVLEAAGIPVGFDPYRPGIASSPYPAPYRAFKVVVPESLRATALETVREAGLVIPGESRSDVVSFGEAAIPGQFSDGVLDEDVEAERVQHRRRAVSAIVVTVLIVVLLASLFSTIGYVLSTARF